MKPEKGTYPPYFENYIPNVQEDNLILAFQNNWKEISKTLGAIPYARENYAYAPGKWTIKQMVNHLIDTERIFAYRALRFARKDPQQPLTFEEDHYAANADVSRRSLAELLEEFDTVRKATLSLYTSLPPEALHLSGNTAAGPCTVLAMGYAICGHAAHHLKVLKSRYL
jgi:hypothetical protein